MRQTSGQLLYKFWRLQNLKESCTNKTKKIKILLLFLEKKNTNVVVALHLLLDWEARFVAFDRVISAVPVFQTFLCQMPGLPLFIFMLIDPILP